ncbi:MAG TPA: pilin [bacterium]|nr:MAG: hypothetical protein H6759_05425 [Candidatus Nomurabacteria bacterium]HPF95006.1 pilin [bacterium]
MKRTIKTVFAFVTAIMLAMPAVTFAQLTPANTGLTTAAAGTGLSTGCSGTECVVTIIANVINIVLGFLGVVLLLIVMYAGFKWMTADKEDDVKNAKSMIKNAVAGLVVITVSYAFAAFVIETLGTLGNPAQEVPAPTQDDSAGGQPRGSGSDASSNNDNPPAQQEGTDSFIWRLFGG